MSKKAKISPAQVKKIESRILEVIERDRAQIIAISRDIHAHPEIGYKEVRTSGLLTDKLQQRGFEVDRATADIETAFVGAAGKNEGPTIAFIAEMDALPGLGHACGHNLIGCAALAAGLALKEVIDELPARVQVIGTPAEEGGGGKVLMTNRGVFDKVDAAMMFHPLDRSGIHAESLAASTCEVHMYGKAAHAAANPEDGINALDAIIQTFNNVNALRQHLRSDTRIHGIIMSGGQAPNITPDYASAKFRVRAADRKYADEALEKFKRCAEAAALAQGARCELKVIEASRYDNMISNNEMENIFAARLTQLGVPFEDSKGGGLGSTDMGNVSQVVPSIHPYVKIGARGIAPHTNEFREAAGSDEGMNAMIIAAKAMALTALDLIAHPDKLAAARAEFKTVNK